MSYQDEVQTALTRMILSHSGWRGVFAVSGGEEDKTGEISGAHEIIAAAAAAVFSEYLGGRRPTVLIGRDTRPTGTAIVDAMLPVLQARGCNVRYAGVMAAPEIMAWARGFNMPHCGFIYISASHNPIGHNGLKFGLGDGGVLPAREAAKLTASFRSLMTDTARLEKLIAEKSADANAYPLNPAVYFTAAEPSAIAKQDAYSSEKKPVAAISTDKQEAYDAYFRFSEEVAYNGTREIADALKSGLEKRPLGVCCDFNGSARCVSIDREFFKKGGISFAAINDTPGAIAHRIVPEGEALEPCRAFLEEQRKRDPAFIMGYVPDCDGDRGNLVIWDETIGQARPLEAQEVFALACTAELAQLRWAAQFSRTTPFSRVAQRNRNGESAGGTVAVVVNDPTSLRIDRIAAAFGAEVFRAEVGEANVVGLARSLREEGYIVRILGEGSAGGNITHPSAVRDPLQTVMALIKFLSIRSTGDKPGLFEIWCNASGQKERYHADFTLADIIAGLPPFATTGAYSPEAALHISCTDHGALKKRYQNIFLREWEERKDDLKARYGIYGWEAAAYNGTIERKGISDFSKAGTGGLKICFHNAAGIAIASLWMRGSATEPVFRIMADIEGPNRHREQELIEWQRRMTLEANRS